VQDFAGKVAVVTGSASGICLGLSRTFMRNGMSVAMLDVRGEQLKAAIEKVRPLGQGRVIAIETDVSKAQSVEAAAQKVEDEFGKIHVVCNNAGVVIRGTLIEKIDDAAWNWILGVNLYGVIHGIQSFVPRIRKHGEGGHIVNTASMAGLVGMRWLGIYSASKFAVVGLSEALHRELKPLGIGVSVLCPMIVDTQINENSARMRPPELRNAEDLPVPPASAMTGGTIPAAAVAQRVVRAIERGDLYILTHPEQREILHRRAAKLDAMFKEDAW